MKNIRINLKKIISFFSVVFFIFIFLNNHTIYSLSFENSGDIFLIVAILSLFVVILLTQKLYFNKKFYTIILFWFISVAIPCLLSGITRLSIVRCCYWFALLIMIGCLYVAKIDYKKIFYIVCKIFCIWSLLCYFYTIFNLDFLPVTNVATEKMYNWFTVNLYGYVISNPLSHFSFGNISFLRLDRPFGEPGIAQMYFNFGLIYSLFIEKNKKSKNIWSLIFILSVLLSFSTTGILILLTIVLIYIIMKKKYFILFPMFLIAATIACIMIYQKKGTVSYEDRSGDIMFMLKTIFNNLPFGIGIGNTDLLEHNIIASTGTVSIGFYCGLLYPLAEYGILGIVYYIILFNSFKKFSENKYLRIAFSMFVIFTLFTEPDADECFIIAFLYSGLIEFCKLNNQNNRNLIKISENSGGNIWEMRY